MDFFENQPIYLQIANHFCENILLQKWKPNERIPSVRDIAVALEVNPNTAMRAFIYLQDKGIIYNKRGIGYYVSEQGFNKALEHKRAMFIEKEMPLVLKTMKLLNISFEELEKFSKEIPS
ncbi:MAG TPA: GntR family transcriptional regulator [Bacteroidales bacterium]|nr:GntR family transcriptional regulator [Bacteroidales bacterium]